MGQLVVDEDRFAAMLAEADRCRGAINGHGGAQIGHIPPALGTKVLLPQVGCRGRLGTV